jgi:hypothetical protein
MNEQIRELIIQAGFHMRPSIEGCKDGIDWSSSTHGYDQCVEKLIELTVRECAEVGKQSITRGIGMAISSHALPDYINGKIKEHFGVEE